jgi:hypothetical protein
MKRTLLAGLAFAVACGGGGDTGAAGGGEQAAMTTEAAGPMGTATISGTVKFAGKAPANPKIDMAEEPQCKEKYTTTQPTQLVTVVGPGGGLANVFVYVKSGLAADAKYTAPTAPFVIDQDACLYHPRVLGIMVSQPLEIRNSDPLLHNIKAKPTANRPFNISQPAAGMKTTRTFAAPEVMVPLECNVHGWMQAYVGVMAHPFYAVSGSDGSFSIGKLPAGTYTIEAWHEKHGTQTATVTVTEGGTMTQNFSFAATAASATDARTLTLAAR